MARKSATNLKDGPVKLSKASEEFLAHMEARTPYPGTEEQFTRYLSALRAAEEQQARVDAIAGDYDFGDTDKIWPAYQTALSRLTALQSAAFGALDAWVMAEKQGKAEAIRKADPEQSNVEFSSLHFFVSEEFTETGSELQWNLKSVGLVAYKLSEAVSGFLVREESQEVPLCPACQ